MTNRNLYRLLDELVEAKAEKDKAAKEYDKLKEELKNKVAGAVDATVKTAKAVNELASKDEKNSGSTTVGK